MYDGIVRTLIEVLITVGAMDSKGFSCWIEGGVMQIKRKGKFVVMQRTKQGSLYILQGSPVTGTISTVSQVGSYAFNGSSNENYLWHLCLGHMSEKGLEVLS